VYEYNLNYIHDTIHAHASPPHLRREMFQPDLSDIDDAKDDGRVGHPEGDEEHSVVPQRGLSAPSNRDTEQDRVANAVSALSGN